MGEISENTKNWIYNIIGYIILMCVVFTTIFSAWGFMYIQENRIYIQRQNELMERQQAIAEHIYMRTRFIEDIFPPLDDEKKEKLKELKEK